MRVATFVAPTIFADVDPNSDLAQKVNFWPRAHSVIKAKNMEQALKIANSTEYALTGGLLFTQPCHD